MRGQVSCRAPIEIVRKGNNNNGVYIETFHCYWNVTKLNTRFWTHKYAKVMITVVIVGR